MTSTGSPALHGGTPLSPDRLDRLSPAERRVAEHLLAGGPQALVLSAAALAERTGTSDATVVRTAKALGYAGLGELRQALAASQSEPALAERLARTLAASRPDELLATSIAGHLRGLEGLARRVPAERFAAAVALLAGARRVAWRGVGPSACLADYGRLLCRRVGRPATALTQSGTAFADELLDLDGGDAVVALAYGRLQPHVGVLLDRTAALGCPVVLVTDVSTRRLGDRVALVLESGRGERERFASHAATLVLVEALVLGLAATDAAAADASLTELNDLRAALAGRRVDVDER